MRIKLDIADDVLQAARAKEIAPSHAARLRNGVPVLPRRAPEAKPPTRELVEELRDEACPDLAERHDDHFADVAGHRPSLPPA